MSSTRSGDRRREATLARAVNTTVAALARAVNTTISRLLGKSRCSLILTTICRVRKIVLCGYCNIKSCKSFCSYSSCNYNIYLFEKVSFGKSTFCRSLSLHFLNKNRYRDKKKRTYGFISFPFFSILCKIQSKEHVVITN